MENLENKFIQTVKQILEILETNLDENVILDKLNTSVWINFIDRVLSDHANYNLINDLQINDDSSVESVKSFINKKTSNNFDYLDVLRKSYFVILQEFVSNLENNFPQDKITNLRKIVSEGV